MNEQNLNKVRDDQREDEENQRSIAADIQANPSIGQMFKESLEAYHRGDYLTTEELIRSLSPEDFRGNGEQTQMTDEQKRSIIQDAVKEAFEEYDEVFKKLKDG